MSGYIWKPKRKKDKPYALEEDQPIAPIYADRLVVVFGDKAIQTAVSYRYSDFESMTFNDVLELAKKNGYKEWQSLFVAVEAPMHGLVFAYGRYSEKFWELYGHTKGYA